MSTPDFDAAVERAARAAYCAPDDDGPTFTTKDWDEVAGREVKAVYRDEARAALQASGWEEAAAIAHELAINEFSPEWKTRRQLEDRARAWVAQYTPEGK